MAGKEHSRCGCVQRFPGGWRGLMAIICLFLSLLGAVLAVTGAMSDGNSSDLAKGRARAEQLYIGLTCMATLAVVLSVFLSRNIFAYLALGLTVVAYTKAIRAADVYAEANDDGPYDETSFGIIYMTVKGNRTQTLAGYVIMLMGTTLSFLTLIPHGVGARLAKGGVHKLQALIGIILTLATWIGLVIMWSASDESHGFSIRAGVHSVAILLALLFDSRPLTTVSILLSLETFASTTGAALVQAPITDAVEITTMKGAAGYYIVAASMALSLFTLVWRGLHEEHPAGDEYGSPPAAARRSVVNEI